MVNDDRTPLSIPSMLRVYLWDNEIVIDMHACIGMH